MRFSGCMSADSLDTLDTHTDIHRHTQTDIQTYRETHRYRQTDTPRHRQTERQTDM